MSSYTPKMSFSTKKQRAQTPMTSSRWGIGLFGGKTPAKTPANTPANTPALPSMTSTQKNNQQESMGNKRLSFSLGVAAPSPWRPRPGAGRANSRATTKTTVSSYQTDFLDRVEANAPKETDLIPSSANNQSELHPIQPSKKRTHGRLQMSSIWGSRGNKSRRHRTHSGAATRRIIAATKELAFNTKNKTQV